MSEPHGPNNNNNACSAAAAALRVVCRRRTPAEAAARAQSKQRRRRQQQQQQQQRVLLHSVYGALLSPQQPRQSAAHLGVDDRGGKLVFGNLPLVDALIDGARGLSYARACVPRTDGHTDGFMNRSDKKRANSRWKRDRQSSEDEKKNNGFPPR